MSIVETARSIVDLIGKGSNIELQERLMKLREEALDLEEENLNLRQRVSELEAKAEQSEQLSFDEGVYWRELDDGDTDGPFCQTCFDKDQRLIRLQEGGIPFDGNDRRWWDCHVCNAQYNRESLDQ